MIQARDPSTGRIIDQWPDTKDERYCPECDAYLPKSQFYADKRAKSGLTRRCRTHHIRRSYDARLKRPVHERYEYARKLMLKNKYGLTVEDYETMYEAQEGKCAICRRPEKTGKGLLHVDHCHETGKVRALLCSDCNTGLGKFDHDVNFLLAAIAYLKKHAA